MLKKILLFACIISSYINTGYFTEQTAIQCSTLPEHIIYKVQKGETTFFAVKPHADKIKYGKHNKNYSRQELLCRFTQEHHDWYANHSNNPELNALIDHFITYLQEQIFSKKRFQDKPSLAIFDIDETISTSYAALFNVVMNDVEHNTYTWHSVTHLTPSTNFLEPIQPMFRLYDFFLKQGCKIAFVTRRPDTPQQRDFTVKQLHDLGYTEYDELHFCPSHHKGTGGLYKEEVRRNLAHWYQIIATIDDSHLNLEGEHLGIGVLWVPSPLAGRDQEMVFFEKTFLEKPNEQTSYCLSLRESPVLENGVLAENEPARSTEFSFVLKPSALGGIGVFAVHDIAAGTLLFTGKHTLRRLKTKELDSELVKYCIFINDEECVGPEQFDRMEIGWYLNHSCAPNIATKAQVTKSAEIENLIDRTIYAIKDIKKGDEILIDYNGLNEPEHLKEDYYR